MNRIHLFWGAIFCLACALGCSDKDQVTALEIGQAEQSIVDGVEEAGFPRSGSFGGHFSRWPLYGVILQRHVDRSQVGAHRGPLFGRNRAASAAKKHTAGTEYCAFHVRSKGAQVRPRRGFSSGSSYHSSEIYGLGADNQYDIALIELTEAVENIEHYPVFRGRLEDFIGGDVFYVGFGANVVGGGEGEVSNARPLSAWIALRQRSTSRDSLMGVYVLVIQGDLDSFKLRGNGRLLESIARRLDLKGAQVFRVRCVSMLFLAGSTLRWAVTLHVAKMAIAVHVPKPVVTMASAIMADAVRLAVPPYSIASIHVGRPRVRLRACSTPVRRRTIFWNNWVSALMPSVRNGMVRALRIDVEDKSEDVIRALTPFEGTAIAGRFTSAHSLAWPPSAKTVASTKQTWTHKLNISSWWIVQNNIAWGPGS